jgi:hypothetical protein
MPENLVTLAEYKAYAKKINPNDDAAINLLIPAVSALVKTICRRSFIDYITTPKVDILNGGFKNLIPREYPILEVVSLEESTDNGVTYSPITNYAVNWESADEIVCTDYEFSKGYNRYKLTYKCGFLTVPEDLKLGIMDLITYYLKNDMAVHSTKAPGTNSVQIEYITSSNLPIHIRRVLDLYVADYL